MGLPSYEELQGRLYQAELALERSERLVVASRYANAIMHEVNNPLEAMTNLVYLTKIQPADPDQVCENMLIVEEQLAAIARITKQVLTFHREQKEAGEIDLVEIAESALKLHDDKLRRHGVTVERDFRGPAAASGFGSEILQVLSNLILNAVDSVPVEADRLSICIEVRGDSAHIERKAERRTTASDGRGGNHRRRSLSAPARGQGWQALGKNIYVGSG